MRSLNASQPHPHFVAILQLTFRDALLQSGKSFFDLGHKAAADGFLFLLPPLCTTEDIGLLTTPRSKIHTRRAFPYFRSTVRRIASTVVTSARFPSNSS